MKPHVRFWNGKWWCRYMGVTGCGSTPEAALKDMRELHDEAFKPKIRATTKVRFA